MGRQMGTRSCWTLDRLNLMWCRTDILMLNLQRCSQAGTCPMRTCLVEHPDQWRMATMLWIQNRRKLTNKEKAAMGANRVGIWTRHRALCPHDRQISVDLWKPDHCSWVKELNHDIASVANKFKKCRPNRAEFFSLLVVVLVLSPPTNRGSYDPIFEMVNHSICNW